MDELQRRALSDSMVRLADGDRDAFDAVFAALWPPVRRFCARVLGSDPDAEDVAQRVALSVFGRASEYDPERDALTWALGIAAWECRTYRRRIERRRQLELQRPDAPSHAPTSEDALVHGDLVRALGEIVGTLSAADRAALGLADDPRDASTPTRRKRRQRALGRIRAAWSRIHEP